MDKIIPIGTETQFGKIVAVGNIGGERYYWCIDKLGTVSMMPECAFNQQIKYNGCGN